MAHRDNRVVHHCVTWNINIMKYTKNNIVYTHPRACAVALWIKRTMNKETRFNENRDKLSIITYHGFSLLLLFSYYYEIYYIYKVYSMHRCYNSKLIASKNDWSQHNKIHRPFPSIRKRWFYCSQHFPLRNLLSGLN